MVGVFAMRWNVVIGGQLFSKSFLGYTTYKIELVTREGLFMTIALLILPLVILFFLTKLLPPWEHKAKPPLGQPLASNSIAQQKSPGASSRPGLVLRSN